MLEYILYSYLATGTVDALTCPATCAFFVFIFTCANKIGTTVGLALTGFLHKLKKTVIVEFGRMTILAETCCMLKVHFSMWWFLLQEPGFPRDDLLFSLQ